MDNNLSDMRKMAESLKGLTENMLSKALTKEVLSDLTPEELNIISEAKNALNFDGLQPSEKLNNLTSLLRKHGL